MAIQDETGPVLVTVYCDDCEVHITQDYLVPAGQDSLTVARQYLATHKGWEITPRTDLCGDCKPAAAAPSGPSTPEQN